VPALGGESAFYAEPSPDGRWLAWVRYPDGTLWRSRPDGSERLQLTGAPMEAHSPRWSPDGRRIVFVARTAEDPQLVVRVVSADASAAEMIARPEKPSFDYWDPCWLPDGSILFSHLNLAGGIFRFDPAARHVERLPGTEGIFEPKCSSTGNVLAARVEQNSRSPFVVQRAGGSWEDVDLPESQRLAYPNWRRAGRSFCGLSSSDADTTIKCYSIADHRLEILASTQGLPLASWMPHPWMGLDADGLPFVTADRSTRALYALDFEAP
jgi:Tol biopolymer transport system component